MSTYFPRTCAHRQASNQQINKHSTYKRKRSSIYSSFSNLKHKRRCTNSNSASSPSNSILPLNRDTALLLRYPSSYVHTQKQIILEWVNQHLSSSPTFPLSTLHSNAIHILQSIETIQTRVHQHIKSNKIRVRDDKPVYLDLTLQAELLSLLSHYHPQWLYIGLYATIGPKVFEIEGVQSEKVFRSLRSAQKMPKILQRLIVRHIISDTNVSRRTRVQQSAYFQSLQEQFLNHFLILILILDRAHSQKLTYFPGFPGLFVCGDSKIQDSQEILHTFNRLFLHQEGRIDRELAPLGYVVTEKSSVLHAPCHRMEDIADDLRDGVSFAKLIEKLAVTERSEHSLSNLLRLPAISILQKVYNVQVCLSYVNELFGGSFFFTESEESSYFSIRQRQRAKKLEKIAKAMVDGTKDKRELACVDVLWQIMSHSDPEKLVDEEQLKREMGRIEKGLSFASRCFLRLHERQENVLFAWCRCVCAKDKLQLGNAISLTDGRVLSHLIRYYAPYTLEETQWNAQNSNADLKRALERLGGIATSIPDSDDTHAIVRFLSHLQHRLLTESSQTHAVLRLQKWYRTRFAAEKVFAIESTSKEEKWRDRAARVMQRYVQNRLRWRQLKPRLCRTIAHWKLVSFLRKVAVLHRIRSFNRRRSMRHIQYRYRTWRRERLMVRLHSLMCGKRISAALRVHVFRQRQRRWRRQQHEQQEQMMLILRKNTAITIIQANLRCYWQRKSFLKLVSCVRVLKQSYLDRKRREEMSATKIQSQFRTMCVHRACVRLRIVVMKLQARLRGYRTRRNVLDYYKVFQPLQQRFKPRFWGYTIVIWYRRCRARRREKRRLQWMRWMRVMRHHHLERSRAAYKLQMTWQLYAQRRERQEKKRLRAIQLIVRMCRTRIFNKAIDCRIQRTKERNAAKSIRSAYIAMRFRREMVRQSKKCFRATQLIARMWRTFLLKRTIGCRIRQTKERNAIGKIRSAYIAMRFRREMAQQERKRFRAIQLIARMWRTRIFNKAIVRRIQRTKEKNAAKEILSAYIAMRFRREMARRASVTHKKRMAWVIYRYCYRFLNQILFRKKKEYAAICIQRFFRKRLHAQALLHRFILHHALPQTKRRKITRAASRVQACWRGYCARDRIAPPIRSIPKNDSAPKPLTLGARLELALRQLLHGQRLQELLFASHTIEMCTRYSNECCERCLALPRVSTSIYAAMRNLNRSRPHVEVLHQLLLILDNLKTFENKYPKKVTLLERATYAEALVDVLQIHRDMQDIFCLSAKLLEHHLILIQQYDAEMFEGLSTNMEKRCRVICELFMKKRSAVSMVRKNDSLKRKRESESLSFSAKSDPKMAIATLRRLLQLFK